MGVINLISNEKLEGHEWSHGEHYEGKSIPLATQLEAQTMGFRLNILKPKKFSCPYHSHSHEEELFLVVSGNAVMREENQYRPIGPGDLVFFKTGISHQFYNSSSEDFVYLALSNLDKEDTCEYPDSKKKMTRKTREITQEGKKVDDYWLGEGNPRDYWDPKYLESQRTDEN